MGRQLGRPTVVGKVLLKWISGIQVWYMVWICLAQDIDWRRAVMDMMMNSNMP